jgi:hypothetical protein
MNSKLILAGIFGFSGVFLIIMGIVSVIRKRRFIRRSIEKEGVVIALEKLRPGKGGLLAPVIEFTDDKGNTTSFRSSIYKADIAYKEGDRVDVFYDPVEQKGELAEYARMTGSGLIIPLLLCFLGFTFLSTVLVIFILP